MRQKCDNCGEFKNCNDEDICFDCVQDSHDLEEWLPEDDEDSEEFEVE